MMGCTGAEGVLQHLMFHKAMIDEADDAEKIDHYLNVLRESTAAIAPKDPLDRSIETVFELVLNNNLDPWDIDLMQFTQLYTEKVRDQEVNFVIAGKLMLMAWSILRMQSEKVLLGTEDRQPELDFTDEMDWLTDEEPRARLCMPDEVSLSEVVRRHGTRPVTLLELLDAFEDARREEQESLIREKLREANKVKIAAFDTKAHNDDMERDVEDVWQRIMRCGSGAVTLDDIWNGGREDLVTVFMALLFLARAGKISVWQDDVPDGTICLEVRMDWSIGTLEDMPPVPTPRAARMDKDAVI